MDGDGAREDDPEAVITFYGELLLGAAPAKAWRDRLLNTLGPKAAAGRAVALLLASPEAQLA